VWRRKREGVIQDLILQHAQIVLKTVQALYDYISVVRKKKPDKRVVEKEEELGENVLKLERQADELEEKVDEELFRGAFLPVTSSDRFDLIASVDGIADRCEIIVRKLRIIAEPIELDVKEKLSEMARLSVEATEALVESIELMGILMVPYRKGILCILFEKRTVMWNLKRLSCLSTLKWNVQPLCSCMMSSNY